MPTKYDKHNQKPDLLIYHNGDSDRCMFPIYEQKQTACHVNNCCNIILKKSCKENKRREAVGGGTRMR